MTSKINIIMPRFSRSSCGPEPIPLPDDFDELRKISEDHLAELGCKSWGRMLMKGEKRGEATGAMLMLFPHEWYEHIPEGYELVSINFRAEKFVLGETDSDHRGGMLAYGVLVGEGYE